MVHLMFDRSAEEWKPAMEHNGKIIPTVSLNPEECAEDHKTPDCHGVGANDPGRRRTEDTDAEEFPRVDILTDPAVDH